LIQRYQRSFFNDYPRFLQTACFRCFEKDFDVRLTKKKNGGSDFPSLQDYLIIDLRADFKARLKTNLWEDRAHTFAPGLVRY
jgi:hypothetical protein